MCSEKYVVQESRDKSKHNNQADAPNKNLVTDPTSGANNGERADTSWRILVGDREVVCHWGVIGSGGEAGCIWGAEQEPRQRPGFRREQRRTGGHFEGAKRSFR